VGVAARRAGTSHSGKSRLLNVGLKLSTFSHSAVATPQKDKMRIRNRDDIPRCGCGALARPNVSHATDEVWTPCVSYKTLDAAIHGALDEGLFTCVQWQDIHINRARKGAAANRFEHWLNKTIDKPLVRHGDQVVWSCSSMLGFSPCVFGILADYPRNRMRNFHSQSPRGL